MKALLLIFGFVFPLALNAQIYVNGKNIDGADTDYITLILKDVGFGNNIEVWVDYGQEEKFSKLRKYELTDRKGEEVSSNVSFLLTHFNRNGWEYMDSFERNIETNTQGLDYSMTFLLFRRKD